MRNKLKEYIPLTDRERKEIWKKGVFVLDANVLLNMCRYSKQSSDELIAIIKKHKDNIWLPYQVGMEFFNNRLSVIESIRNGFNTLLNNVGNIENILIEGLQFKNFKNETAHNIEELRKDFKKFGKREEAKIKKWQKEFENNDKDAILEEILKLYENKIGNDYDESKLNDLYKEGERRQKENIPPGYADWNDKRKQSIRHACGDLIWWKQAIDYARDKKSDLIIVTDDKKEDWWYKVSGKIISPRVELTREFDKETNGRKFLMYQTHQFMEMAQKLDGAEVSDSSIKEVKETGSLDYIHLFDSANHNFDKILGIVNKPYNTLLLNNIGNGDQASLNEITRQFVSPERISNRFLNGSYNSLYLKSLGEQNELYNIIDIYREHPEWELVSHKINNSNDSIIDSITDDIDSDKK